MGDKKQTTTTTQSQTRDPWGSTVQPLNNIINKSSILASDVGNFTPQFSDQTMRGIDLLTGLSNSGQAGGYDVVSGITSGTGQGFETGLGQLQNTASGGMLNSNQYLDPVIQRVMDDTANRVNSQFTAGGRYGSGAHTGTLVKELGNTAATMRLGNYTTERAAQDNAARTLYGGGITGANYAGQLDQLAKNPALTALQAGNLQDQILNAQRTAPMNAVQWQAGITTPIAGLGGTSSGTSTQESKQPNNWLTTGLGLGAMGLSMLNPATAIGGGFANLAGGLMGGLGGSGGGMVNGFANNDPGGWYYA